MAKIVIDSQSMKVFVVGCALLTIFFYGIHLSFEDINSETYVGEIDDTLSNFADSDFNASDYSPDSDGEIIEVTSNEKTLGGSFTFPAGDIPAGRVEGATFPAVKLPVVEWEWDDDWFSGSWKPETNMKTVMHETELWSDFTMWNSHQIWDAETVDLSTGYTTYEFDLNINRFGGNMFPPILEDTQDMIDRVGTAPDIVVWFMLIIPLSVVLMIIKSAKVSI